MNEMMHDPILKKASGYDFYNKRNYTFDTLLANPASSVSNFRTYLNRVSENMQDILSNLIYGRQ